MDTKFMLSLILHAPVRQILGQNFPQVREYEDGSTMSQRHLNDSGLLSSE